MIGVIDAMWPPLEVLIVGVTSLLGVDTDCGLWKRWVFCICIILLWLGRQPNTLFCDSWAFELFFPWYDVKIYTYPKIFRVLWSSCQVVISCGMCWGGFVHGRFKGFTLLNPFLHSYYLKAMLHKHEWGSIKGIGHCAKEWESWVDTWTTISWGSFTINGHILLLCSEWVECHWNGLPIQSYCSYERNGTSLVNIWVERVIIGVTLFDRFNGPIVEFTPS